MEEKIQFIAISRDYCGIGETLTKAFEDLKDETPNIEFDETRFFEAKEIKAQFEVVKINN